MTYRYYIINPHEIYRVSEAGTTWIRYTSVDCLREVYSRWILLDYLWTDNTIATEMKEEDVMLALL